MRFSADSATERSRLISLSTEGSSARPEAPARSAGSRSPRGRTPAGGRSRCERGATAQLGRPDPPAAAEAGRRHDDGVDAEDFRQIRDAVRELVRESVVPLEEQIEDEDRIPDALRAQA